MRAVLLGTGSPIPDINRWGPATLIEAGGKRFLIDAGRGAALRISQLGLPVGSIDTVFLTHFHSDHTVGLPDLWLTGASAAASASERRPFISSAPPEQERS